MKKSFITLLVLSPFYALAQLNYPSYDNLQSRINKLKNHKAVSVSSIGNSYGGETIPVIKIQQGAQVKPTLLIVAGIDGKHPAGVINSLEVADKLLAISPDSLNRLLQKKSIWIVPLVNPDAYKRNSTSIVWSSGNARIIDNDRDGRVDEDPSKDLNGDKVISQMRVKSIAGTHVQHPQFANVMIEADRSKGEKGAYVILPEGIDADFDGKFGEDGEGGVNIDRNFTFDYRPFTPESGTYAASEPETKAIMEFVYDNPQISTIVQFGLTNNLSEPERFNAGKANERIVSSWSMNDAEVSKYISSIYRETVKSLGEPTKMEHTAGNFGNTAYYHLGKFSFSTPTWWPAFTDTTKNSKPTKSEDLFFKWVEQNNIEGAILPWVKVSHPNFPNQEVEVGGVVDIFRNNPPLSYLKESSDKHADFIQRLLLAMPELEFQLPVVTALGGDIYRVELAVTNIGLMPIYPDIANRIRHTSKFKAVCELQSNQQFLNGKRLQLYPALGPGKTQTFSWLVKGKGNIKIIAGCPTSGEVNLDVKL